MPGKTTDDPAGNRRPTTAIPMGIGCVLALLGLVVLTGWISGFSPLTNLAEGWATMKPNTALGFLLGGVALAGAWCGRRRVVVVVLGTLIAAMGLEALAQYWTGMDLGVDTWGIREVMLGKGPHRGTMSIATGVGFLMSGIALACRSDSHRAIRLFGTLQGGGTLGLGLIGVMGYIFGVDRLYAVSPFSTMAVHTAGSFVLLGLGILTLDCRDASGGIMAGLVNGGLITKRLLPLALFGPILGCWLVLAGLARGWYGDVFGLTLLTLGNIAIFLLILWLLGRKLNQIDVRRLNLRTSLARTERAARGILESLPQLVWTCLPEGPCDYLSPQWVRYTGVPAERQLGYGWLDQLDPDDRQPTLDRWTATVASGLTFDAEFRIRRHDGEYRWFKALAVAVRDEGGRTLKWFGSGTDIHESRKAEEAKTRLGAIVESSTDAIIGKTCDGFVTSWNAGAERLLGYTAAEMIGQRIDRIIPPERQEEERRILESVGNGAPVEPFRTVRLRKDGTRVDLSVTVSPVRDRTGRIVGASKVARDITDQIKMESELRRSRDELERRVAARTDELLSLNKRLQKSTRMLNEAQRLAGCGSWSLDVPSGAVEWSEELFRIVGQDPSVTPPDYECQAWMFTPESWSRLSAAVANSVATGEGYELELDIIRPDGTRRRGLARASTVKDEQGRVVELTGTLLDIDGDGPARA